MTSKFSDEFLYRVSRGLVPGHRLVRKFARNPDLDTTPEYIWTAGGIGTWPTSAQSIEIVSSSANDTSAGTGMREAEIQGLDSNFLRISEVIATNGLTVATLSNSYIRINRAFGTGWGNYHGENDGDIEIRIAGGGAVLGNMDTGVGQTEKAQFTVPANETAYLVRCDASVASSKTATLNFFANRFADDVTAPYTGGKRKITGFTGLVGTGSKEFGFADYFTGPCDLWWEGVGAAVNTQVEIDYLMVLVED